MSLQVLDNLYIVKYMIWVKRRVTWLIVHVVKRNIVDKVLSIIFIIFRPCVLFSYLLN